MLKSALKGYREANGAHEPINTTLLKQARDVQIDYANKFEQSGDALNPIRVAMYPRESAHIGFVVGQQQAMMEKGARLWRRVLHPELSKEGPCAQCTADANLIHEITVPFFEFHPNGVCGIQGIIYQMPSGDIELPLPHTEEPNAFVKIVRELFNQMKHIARRIRR